MIVVFIENLPLFFTWIVAAMEFVKESVMLHYIQIVHVQKEKTSLKNHLKIFKVIEFNKPSILVLEFYILNSHDNILHWDVFFVFKIRLYSNDHYNPLRVQSEIIILYSAKLHFVVSLFVLFLTGSG